MSFFYVYYRDKFIQGTLVLKSCKGYRSNDKTATACNILVAKVNRDGMIYILQTKCRWLNNASLNEILKTTTNHAFIA